MRACSAVRTNEQPRVGASILVYYYRCFALRVARHSLIRVGLYAFLEHNGSSKTILTKTTKNHKKSYYNLEVFFAGGLSLKKGENQKETRHG